MKKLLSEAIQRTYMDDAHDKSIYNKKNGKKQCDTSICYYRDLNQKERQEGRELQEKAIKNYAKIQRSIINENGEMAWKAYDKQNKAVGRKEPALTKQEFMKNLRLRYMEVDPKEPDKLTVSLQVKDKGDFFYPEFLARVNMDDGKLKDWWDPHFG